LRIRALARSFSLHINLRSLKSTDERRQGSLAGTSGTLLRGIIGIFRLGFGRYSSPIGGIIPHVATRGKSKGFLLGFLPHPQGVFQMSKRSSTQPGELVVVCDGRKAMIMENLGDAMFPNLQMREVLEHEDPPTDMQGAAPPGRVHQSLGPARGAVWQTHWRGSAERSFLSKLAHHLSAAVTRDPKTVTVVAAPRALGMLRQSYSPALCRAISDELGKDWVKMPIGKIEKKLNQAKPRLH
jgi:protein required for attachment to host cells